MLQFISQDKLIIYNKTMANSMARMGKDNGRWKGGKSSDYRRRITDAKPGQIVHHKNGDKSDNAKSNFQKLPSIGAHNKKHPEKGGRH
jgi:hypothetical protein